MGSVPVDVDMTSASQPTQRRVPRGGFSNRYPEPYAQTRGQTAPVIPERGRETPRAVDLRHRSQIRAPSPTRLTHRRPSCATVYATSIDAQRLERDGTAQTVPGAKRADQ